MHTVSSRIAKPQNYISTEDGLFIVQSVLESELDSQEEESFRMMKTIFRTGLSREEMLTAIKTFKYRQAAGPDGTTGETTKRAGDCW